MQRHKLSQRCPYRKLQAIYHDYAGALALQLMSEFKLLNNQSLVTMLGHGFERNNREALESWVYAVCMALKLPFHSQSLPVLESTLRAALDALRQHMEIASELEVQHA